MDEPERTTFTFPDEWNMKISRVGTGNKYRGRNGIWDYGLKLSCEATSKTDGKLVKEPHTLWITKSENNKTCCKSTTFGNNNALSDRTARTLNFDLQNIAEKISCKGYSFKVFNVISCSL